jgi:hypothetical protein
MSKLSQYDKQRVEELARDPIGVLSRQSLFPVDHLTFLPDRATVQFWGGKVPSLHSFVLFALVSAQVSWGEGQTGEFAMPYAVLFGDMCGDLGEAEKFKSLCGQVVELYNTASGNSVAVRFSSVLAAPDLIRKMHKYKCVVVKDPSVRKGYGMLTFRLTGETEQKIRLAMADGTLDAWIAEWAGQMGLPKDGIKIQLRDPTLER